MSLKQQAYGLIDMLPDESIQALISVMTCMLPEEKKKYTAAKKMNAYLRLEELRKELAMYDISEAQRNAALDEKFGMV